MLPTPGALAQLAGMSVAYPIAATRSSWNQSGRVGAEQSSARATVFVFAEAVFALAVLAGPSTRDAATTSTIETVAAMCPAVVRLIRIDRPLPGRPCET